jgi:hypothetical protein
MAESERREQQTIAALKARIRQAHQLAKQGAAVMADKEALKKALEQVEASALSRQQEHAIAQRVDKLQARELRLLERDDAWVRAMLAQTKTLSGIMPADSATEADELLWLIADKLNLLDAFAALRPEPVRVDLKTGKAVTRRTMYEPLLLNLLGVLGRFIGVGSGPQMRAALLTDERWVTLLGFNPAEVQQGATHRGEALAGKSRERRSGKFVEAGPTGPAQAREQGPRGVLSPQTMAGHESALSAEKLMVFFNTVVKALAARGYFGPRIHTVIDSTGEEVVPSFEEAGTVRKKVKVKSKARRPAAVETYVRGFKVWYLMEVETGMPVAMTLATIETGENVPVKELFEQAQANLAGHSTIVSTALDRGFLDGDQLWWLKEEKKIDWVCPAKENMKVTEEARERVRQAIAALAKPGESLLETAQRAARQQLIHDGVRFSEREVAEGRAPLVLAEVEDLTFTEFYGKGGSSSSRVHSKKFKPTALHATVVLSWPDRNSAESKIARLQGEENKGPLVLLTAGKQAALVRFDRYDERSLIENRVNRDGKQYFALGATLARNPIAMWSATVFSTVALIFYRALEIEREKAAETSDRRSRPLGILRYRRQCAIQRRGFIIVVIEDRFALMHLRDFAELAGFQVL